MESDFRFSILNGSCGVRSTIGTPTHNAVELSVIFCMIFRVLSVNYSARGLGIGRSFTYGQLEPFRRNHPNLVVLQTGLRCDRTDSWTPQLESDTILNALKYYKKDLGGNSICVERSSRDEFYIDVSNVVNSRSSLFVPPKADVERLTRARKEDPCREHFGMSKTVLEDYNGEFKGAALRHHILQVCVTETWYFQVPLLGSELNRMYFIFTGAPEEKGASS